MYPLCLSLSLQAKRNSSRGEIPMLLEVMLRRGRDEPPITERQWLILPAALQNISQTELCCCSIPLHCPPVCKPSVKQSWFLLYHTRDTFSLFHACNLWCLRLLICFNAMIVVIKVVICISEEPLNVSLHWYLIFGKSSSSVPVHLIATPNYSIFIHKCCECLHARHMTHACPDQAQTCHLSGTYLVNKC